MRVSRVILFAMLAACCAGGPACAAQLVLPDDAPTPYSAYASQSAQRAWSPQRPEAQLEEQPLGEIIATRLGLVEGSAELFRYRLENASSTRAQLDGVVDGGGIKLKLTW